MNQNRPQRATLGRVLRALRKEAHLTQERLGARAGLHRNYIGMVERGEKNASFQSIEAVLAAVDVSWERFGRLLDRTAGDPDGTPE